MAKVSIIVPNYNHSPYLRQRIHSILQQSYQDFEIILLDDSSTDNSQQIIEHYTSHPKVTKVVVNEKNSGSTFTQWNKGVDLAAGELIWIAESDDLADPDLLKTLVDGISGHPETALAYCQSYRMNADGNVTGNWKNLTDDLDTQRFCHDFYMDGKQFIKHFLIFRNVIPNASAVLFKKEVFLQVGKTDTDIKYCSDWLLWLKLLTAGSLFFSAKKMNYFRYHAKSVIAKAGKQQVFVFKYDIAMRTRFDSFIKEQKDDEQLNEIGKSNNFIRSKTSFKEARLVMKHANYRDGLAHVVAGLKNPNQALLVLQKAFARYFPFYKSTGALK